MRSERRIPTTLVVLVTLLLSASCGTEEGEPRGDAEGVQETLRLKFSSPLPPPPFTISEAHQWWADEVTRRSAGKVEFEFHWAGVVSKGGETLDAVQSGLADVGALGIPYYPVKLALTNWSYAVPFGPGDPGVLMEASERLLEQVPELGAEVDQYNQKLLFLAVVDTFNLISKDPVVTLADYRGKTIAAVGAYHPKCLDGAGANAVSMLESELYTSLQTGVIDGVFLPWDISLGYNLHDIAQHACFVDMGGTVDIALTINRDRWVSLPAEIQDLMLAVGREASRERLAELLLDRRQQAIEAFDAKGLTRHEMPFAEKVLWAESLDDLPGLWIEEMEEKGLAGKAVMVGYLDILDDMGHQFPRRWAEAHRD